MKRAIDHLFETVHQASEPIMTEKLLNTMDRIANGDYLFTSEAERQLFIQVALATASEMRSVSFSMEQFLTLFKESLDRIRAEQVQMMTEQGAFNYRVAIYDVRTGKNLVMLPSPYIPPNYAIQTLITIDGVSYLVASSRVKIEDRTYSLCIGVEQL